MKIVTPETAVSYIKSEDRVFIQGAAMTPTVLVKALSDRDQELQNVELISIHTEGDAPYTRPEKSKAFKINSCFVGSNVREAVNAINGDYIPIFLSEIHYLFRRKVLPLQAALIQVSPPRQAWILLFGCIRGCHTACFRDRGVGHCAGQSAGSQKPWGWNHSSEQNRLCR